MRVLARRGRLLPSYGPESAPSLLLQMVEVLDLTDLLGTCLAQSLDLAAQHVVLLFQQVFEILDLRYQQPVVQGYQVEILVAVDQVGEILRCQQDLPVRQRPPHIEIAGTTCEEDFLLHQLVLRSQ